MNGTYFPDDQLQELERFGEVSEVLDGVPLVLIEGARLGAHLKIPDGLDLLICPSARDTYTTRVFFSARVVGVGVKQPNWRDEVRLVGRAWQSYSYQGVPASLRLAQILSAHLGELG